MTKLYSTALLAGITALVLSLNLASAQAADNYAIDSAKSTVAFTIMNKPPNAKKSGPVPGFFKKFTGTIVLDAKDASKSSVSMVVDTASIDTGNKKRDDHLRNQDFFKVKEHPKMSFKSTKVTKKDNGNYEVEGKFTLLGKSKPITIDYKPLKNGGGVTSFRIKRSDYGMGYRVPDTADEVDITLTIVTKKN